MILRIRRNNNTPRTIVTTAFVVIGLAFGIWSYLQLQRPADAADLRNFDPSNIMSDSVMSNKNSMTEAQIQAFLESKNPCNNTNISKASVYHKVKDGRFVCMYEDTFNGETAAHIIWQAAQDYSINPQVIIVLLQKEQGLITDTWPNSIQYRSATGYGCPDTAACDAQYYGLKNQIRQAANLFRNVLNGGWTNYPVGNNYVQYNPNTACGGTTINIKNRATSALYRYTPYQPNQSALNAGYGTGDSCGAYGNRNFWLYFTDWFGSTYHPGADAIAAKNSSISWLGEQTSDVRTIGTSGLYQLFENGKIYWSKDTGAHAMRFGSIDNRYAALGYEAKYLGYPTSDEITMPGIGTYQSFQGGQIYQSLSTGAWDIRYGAMFSKYTSLGYESGYLGLPSSSEIKIKNGTYQSFQGGRLYWQSNSPNMSFSVKNNIIDNYKQDNYDSGYLGLPESDTLCGLKNSGCWQGFVGGKIYWSTNSGSFDIHYGDMNNKYAELKYEGGVLGYPTSREEKTGTTCRSFSDVYQTFQGGTLYWSACSSPTVRVELK